MSPKALKVHFVCVIVFLLGTTGIFAWQFLTPTSQQSLIQGDAVSLVGWPSYQDQSHGIQFHYPPEWNVVSEHENIVRISPPDANSRVPDFEAGTWDFGIRIMPFGAPYPSFPVTLTEQDVRNRLARVSSFSFQITELRTLNAGHTLLIYNIGHDGRSLLALKSVGGRTLQVEMGRHFKGNLSSSDFVAFIGVVASLR